MVHCTTFCLSSSSFPDFRHLSSTASTTYRSIQRPSSMTGHAHWSVVGLQSTQVQSRLPRCLRSSNVLRRPQTSPAHLVALALMTTAAPSAIAWTFVYVLLDGCSEKMPASDTRTLAVPYSHSLASTTPPSRRGHIDAVPVGWQCVRSLSRTKLLVFRASASRNQARTRCRYP